MMNGDSHAQRKDELPGNARVQSLMSLAAEINQGAPPQLSGDPVNSDAAAAREPVQRQENGTGESAGISFFPAISGPAPVQLKLPSIQEFVHSIDQEQAQKEQIDRILIFLAQYLEEKNKKQPNIQILFAYIDFLDTSINQWFDVHKEPDMKKVANGPYLLHLHEEVAMEHERLVEIAYQNPDKVIPVNLATLSVEEAVAVHRIWKPIVSGSGNISVVGTSDFQKKMYANLARLLQGSYGRAMIEYLDGGEVKTSNRTTIGANFDETFARHGTKGEPKGSYAFPRASLTDDEDKSSDVIVEKVDKHYPVAVTRDDINRLMLAGAPGVNHKGVSYTFGTGGGSLVKIVEEGGKSLTDKQLNQILTPSYLTLGHELGHAMRNRGGASFAHAGSGTFDKLLLEEEGSTDAQARTLWTDPEEIVNITSSENKLRQEHLLTERNYHATQDVVAGTKFQQALNTLLNKVPEPKYVSGSHAWQTQIAPVINDPDWTPEKLTERLRLLPAIENSVLPVARKKYAIEKQLTDLRQKHKSLISRDDFMKIKEVREVLSNLRTENWDEGRCQLKVNQVTKMMNDKAWWRKVKIGGAIFASLAAIGVGVYLKYFSGN